MSWWRGRRRGLHARRRWWWFRSVSWGRRGRLLTIAWRRRWGRLSVAWWWWRPWRRSIVIGVSLLGAAVVSSSAVAIVAVVALVVCAGRPSWLAVLVVLKVVCWLCSCSVSGAFQVRQRHSLTMAHRRGRRRGGRPIASAHYVLCMYRVQCALKLKLKLKSVRRAEVCLVSEGGTFGLKHLPTWSLLRPYACHVTSFRQNPVRSSSQRVDNLAQIPIAVGPDDQFEASRSVAG